MSQAIKDIMIKYGADDSDFQKGQKAVNKSLNQNKSTARELDKQFKSTFDTSDITPLIKQQDYLTKALDASKDQASLLEYNMSQMNKAADDFDETTYAKLEADLAKARTQASYLEKDLKKVNQNIDAINTGSLEDMSYDFKRAATNAGVLEKQVADVNKEISTMDKLMNDVTDGEGVSGAIDNVSNLDTSMAGLLQTVLSLPGPLKAVGAAVLGIGAAATASARSTDRLNQMMISLEPACEATGIAMETATTATEALYRATGDLEGSIAAVNTTMAIYGKSVDTATGLTLGAASVLQLQKEGYLDSAEAINIAQSAQDDFNVSALGTYSVLRESSKLIAQYPGQVDDLGDSFKEFGDLMAGMGYDINEFFTFLNTGMVLGAKNTDELVNMVNELFIRITEGGDEVEAALNLIGTSTAEMQALIAEGKTPQVLAEILFALNGVEDATAQATASAALFGTMGEEFVTPMLQNQSVALTQLETTYRLNQQATAQLTQLLSGNLSPALEQVALQMGLSSQEVANLTYKFDQGGFAALNLTEKVALLAAGVVVNGAAMGITSEQAQGMSEKLLVLSDDTATLQEKLKVLNGDMLKFLFSGVLNEEQMAQLTEKFNAQVTALQEQVQAYTTAGGAVGIFTQTLWDNYGAIIENQTGMDKGAWAALGYEEQIKTLGEAMGLTRGETRELENAFVTFQNAADGSSAKTQAFKDMLTILKGNGFVPNIEALSTFIPLLSELQSGMDGSIAKSNDLTGSFAGMGRELDPTNDDLKTYIKRLEESQSAMDKATKFARDFADSLSDIGREAEQAADEVDRLNDKLSTNASMPAPSSGGNAYSMPQIHEIPTPGVSSRSETHTTTITKAPTFNANVTINGSDLTVDEQTKVLKDAFDRFWFEKGRLL